MNFDNSTAKKMEVYKPSFDRGQENIKSRENLIQNEKISRIDENESLEESFARIEEVAQKNLNEARSMAKAFLLKKEYFGKVAGIEPEMLNFLIEEAGNLFESYFSALEAANKLMKEKLQKELERDKELNKANTREEFEKINKMGNFEINLITQSYQRMSELYHLAEQKIEELFREYFPRKNEITLNTNNQLAA